MDVMLLQVLLIELGWDLGANLVFAQFEFGLMRNVMSQHAAICTRLSPVR